MNVALRPPAGGLDLLSICTGGGGLDLGVELAIPGARSVCMVEREAYAVDLLVEAMAQGLVAPAPVWSDARTFNGRRWRGLVDGLIGGIPCQPHSLAGKRMGAEDERDLWSVARRIIVQSGAWWVLIENVEGMLSSGGADRVRRNLHRLGFDLEGGLFAALEVRAGHVRPRVFILGVADARSPAAQRWGGAGEFLRPQGEAEGEGHKRERRRHAAGGRGEGLGDAIGGVRDGRSGEPGAGSAGGAAPGGSGEDGLFVPGPSDLDAWHEFLAIRPDLKPAVRRGADGLADRVDRLRMLGNGVVPLQAAYALRTLATRLSARSRGAALLVRMMEAA